jgi:hypothetical protein
VSRPIHVAGNAPYVGTGYGQQIDQLTRLLLADEYDVAVTCNYGLQSAKLEWNGLTLYPAGYDVWGNDIGGQYVKHFNADLWITLQDVWVLAEDYCQKLRPAAWAASTHWRAWSPYRRQLPEGGTCRLG